MGAVELDIQILPSKRIRGKIEVGPDKSITHRAFIFSTLAEGTSRIKNPLKAADTISTVKVLESIGHRIIGDWKSFEVQPAENIVSPEIPLFCGNSGTTTRLMVGYLSSIEDGFFVLYGDESLSKRPMLRVVEPLRKMGAVIHGRNNDNNLPISIKGQRLHGITYSSKIASAQVKSAVLIATLKADSETIYTEPYKSRDHTERMFKAFGADIKVEENTIFLKPSKLKPFEIFVPGDISSAAFFIVLSAIHPDSFIEIHNVGLNETRTGIIEILKLMGANIEYEIKENEPEPFGTVRVSSSKLKGVEIPNEIIPTAIDELPLVALLGAFAEGETVLKNAEELRKKESDRIKAVVDGMKNIGVEIEELEDGFRIEGPQKIKGGVVDSYMDHRIAMLFAIAGIVSEEGVLVRNFECVEISFPNFLEILKEVLK